MTAELHLSPLACDAPDVLLPYAMGTLQCFCRNKEKESPLWQAAADARAGFTLDCLARKQGGCTGAEGIAAPPDANPA